MPIDSIGCFSNSTFSWIKKYHCSIPKRKKNELPTVEIPITQQITDLLFPKGPASDSAAINTERLSMVNLKKKIKR